MRCPFCNYHDSRVVDSRSVDDGASIRRRRECPDCGRRFTTYEKYEETPLVVNKKDGRRELFDSKKLLNGLIKAFEKRPISYEKIKEMADHIERELRMRGESEVRSEVIGELVMKHLEKTDQIAYVRFASVYRQFADVNNFMQELQRIINNNFRFNKKRGQGYGLAPAFALRHYSFPLPPLPPVHLLTLVPFAVNLNQIVLT